MTKIFDMKFSAMWLITCAASIVAAIFWTGFQIAIFTSTIDGLRQQVSSMQTVINGWEGQVEPLATQIARLSASADTQNTRISNLESNVRDLQNGIISRNTQK